MTTENCGICGSNNVNAAGYHQFGAHGTFYKCQDCGATCSDGGDWNKK